ncbi:MAG: ABC transporter permease subunit [Treponema sp.]|uniref:ABC transporter permease n=1 Tax=Treponema sp. TaxID=166 RepID=UPI0025D97B69|nr:ABC transporter permease subunit [Treponema sp.]MBQ9283137.1 ABC transporter permease subunit [Treponema sp.]
MNQRIQNLLRRGAPVVGILLALLVQLAVSDDFSHPVATKHYYNDLLYILLTVTILFFALSFFFKRIRDSLTEKGPFFFGSACLVIIINLITAKFALLPVIFFPTYDNILAVFLEQTQLLLNCIWHSFRLLILGVFWGVLLGFITGVFLGFSKKVYYWINPYIKLIGPIPATAWIPLVLTTFPTPFGASVFIIALAVWFPVQLMTSSGIQNTSKVYFEVGKTLGAGTFFQVFKIAVPAALPNIFQGVFNGICAAFIALMTAEMFGAKYGIGWYISYQKAMMMYAGVYAGLIMIAVFCTVIITALFKVRKRLLGWQKGLIKW